MNCKNRFRINIWLFLIITLAGCTDNDIPQKENNDIPPKEEPTPPKEDTEESLFDILNLDYSGLEEVKALYKAGDNDAAMQKLLAYYQNRTEILNPNLSATLNETEQGYADYAINEYRFYVNDNYLEDNNNLIIRSFGNQDITLKPFEGRISYQTDRKFSVRKAYSLVMEKKKNVPVRYITILYPVTTAANHKINATFTDNPSNSDNVSIEVTIDNEIYNLDYQLKN